MRALVCLWLVACWRDAPAPHDPQQEASEPEPAPTSRIALTAPPPKADPFGELLAGFEDYVDQMCRCSDYSCAMTVTNDLQQWNASISPELRNLNLTPEQRKQLSDFTTRLSDCLMKAMQAGSGGASPTP
ncbi:MAG TPA: hypothetical protein VMJ10_36345 [Kofleriaceae bacterium]|nr:hypothetical protein [Kofleriaceae bacterium]